MIDGWDEAAESPERARGFQQIVVAGRPFAVPALAVLGHLDHTPSTPVPGSAPSIRGVLMFEGQVVPVLATAVRLALLVPAGRAGGSKLLQLEVVGETFFLEVDAVGGVLAPREITATATATTTTTSSMVAGFVDANGRALAVLNLVELTDYSSEAAPRP